MLSESKELNPMSKLNEKKRLRALPELERPRTVRLKFQKIGTLQYISHLDLQRTFNRVIVRACIPAWYTKGFNPHAKLVFSTPLSVGAQSVYEFLDIRIDRDMDCKEIMERLNRELTDELCILDAYLPENDFSQIAWASYEIVITSDELREDLVEAFKKTLTTSPLLLTKRTKSGEKEIDIVPLIHNLDVDWIEESKQIKLTTTLKATSTEFLNPEMLITALKNQNGILAGDPMREWYSILRTAVYKEDFSLFI